MSSPHTITINGAQIAVPSGSTVAVAMVVAGKACRVSVSGEPRGPLCGMGICYECRVTVSGDPHCLGCQIVCEAGMEVTSDE